MAGFVDLHIHSHFSGDGEFSPRELFEMAARSDLCAFSISDHDTLAAADQGLLLAKEFEIEFVPNVEISTEYQDRSYHVLAPLIDPHDRELDDLLAAQQLARVEQARGRVARLQELGFDITYDEVERSTGEATPVGPAIAELLLQKQSSRSDSRLQPYLTGEKSRGRAIHFYRDFFRRGCPAYAEARDTDLLKALQVIRESGGVPVLAHPGAKGFSADEAAIEFFTQAGMEGLEVYSSYHSPQDTQRFAEIADRFGLVASAGSDFHGRVKPHVAFGSVRFRGRDLLEELKRRCN
ncbi:MAG: PHP domain-containing protein [Acidobacteriota bacterium]